MVAATCLIKDTRSTLQSYSRLEFPNEVKVVKKNKSFSSLSSILHDVNVALVSLCWQRSNHT